MPLVDINLVKGAWTMEQKQEMIRVTTDALVGIWGENVRPMTWVRVLETEDGQWGIGGVPFTVESANELRGWSNP
ncbi:MAG: 4-oxalocrotonate tautomerase [Frankiales bacterium]|nr:4-oxalocrotonate tautomerase [Frankiales bacterium]